MLLHQYSNITTSNITNITTSNITNVIQYVRYVMSITNVHK